MAQEKMDTGKCRSNESRVYVFGYGGNGNYHINTICVQGGYEPKNGEPRALPIVQSSTYKYELSKQMGDLFDLI